MEVASGRCEARHCHQSMLHLALPVFALFLAVDPAPAATALDQGYRQMYDLQFDEAHKTFAEDGRLHPTDPLIPASDAAAHLFAEFDRLNILQSEFFVHDNNFRNPKRLNPDPGVRQAFDAELAKAGQIATGVLASAPQDANALFATILVSGLRADYDGLIDKHYLSSLSSVKNSRVVAEKLLAIDPTCYDAHLAVGVENFMLSLKPAPLRLLLRLTGAETDRELGLQRLRLTAEKGHYLKPYAQLLLAVAALRNQDREQARAILRVLAMEFPHNRLYVEELARLP
jgi:hypothetical protein